MTALTHVLTLVVPLMILVGLAAWLWSGVWAARDAARRGKPGWLVGLLVLLIAWPVSLLVWIALRPENVRRPPFDLNRFRVQ